MQNHNLDKLQLAQFGLVVEVHLYLDHIPLDIDVHQTSSLQLVLPLLGAPAELNYSEKERHLHVSKH